MSFTCILVPRLVFQAKANSIEVYHIGGGVMFKSYSTCTLGDNDLTVHFVQAISCKYNVSVWWFNSPINTVHLCTTFWLCTNRTCNQHTSTYHMHADGCSSFPYPISLNPVSSHTILYIHPLIGSLYHSHTLQCRIEPYYPGTLAWTLHPCTNIPDTVQ